ncbi:hypothetical protein L249_6550, partial [Ophiocordyceps polyrhachis-furcata BCC 54312]
RSSANGLIHTVSKQWRLEMLSLPYTSNGTPGQHELMNPKWLDLLAGLIKTRRDSFSDATAAEKRGGGLASGRKGNESTTIRFWLSQRELSDGSRAGHTHIKEAMGSLSCLLNFSQSKRSIAFWVGGKEGSSQRETDNKTAFTVCSIASRVKTKRLVKRAAVTLLYDQLPGPFVSKKP